jgi:hypothetical protein
VLAQARCEVVKVLFRSIVDDVVSHDRKNPRRPAFKEINNETVWSKIEVSQDYVEGRHGNRRECLHNRLICHPSPYICPNLAGRRIKLLSADGQDPSVEETRQYEVTTEADESERDAA